MSSRAVVAWLLGCSSLAIAPAPLRSAAPPVETVLAELDPALEPLFLPAVPKDFWWTFSASTDSSRAAVYAKQGERQVLLINGVLSPAYDEIGAVQFGPAGDRHAYAVRKGQKWHVVLDGKEGAAWDAVGGLTFSPDGRRFTHAGKRNGRWRIVEGLAEGPEFEDLDAPIYRSPGADYVHFGKRDGKWALIGGAESGARWDGIGAGTFVVSADGRRFAFAARLGEEWHMIVDGEASPGFAAVTRPVFSHDGSQVTYRARPFAKRVYSTLVRPEDVGRRGTLFRPVAGPTPLSDVWLVVAGGEVRDANFVLTGPLPLPGTGQFVYTSGDHTKSTVFIAGRPALELRGDGKGPFIVGDLAVSPNGRRLALRLTQLRKLWLSGQRWIRTYDVRTDAGSGSAVLENPRDDEGVQGLEIQSLMFSEAGDHLAYVVVKSFGGASVVLDGHQGKAYDQILQGTLRFAGDSLMYVARAGRRVVRVSQDLRSVGPPA